MITDGEKPYQGILDKLKKIKQKEQGINKVDDVIERDNYNLVRVPKDKDVDLEVRDGEVYMK